MNKHNSASKLFDCFYLKKTVIFFLFFFFFPLVLFCQVITSVTNGATSIDITANSSQTGTLYYVLYNSNPSSTTATSIKNDATGTGGGSIIRHGTLTIINGETGQDVKKLITNLTENTTYQLYGVFENGGNLGSVQNFSPSLGIRQQSKSYISQITADGQFGYKIRYWVYKPESYYKNPGKNYPVLMFFHGLGELGQNDGDEYRIINAGGPPRMIRDGQEMEYIVVSPQAYNDGWGPVKYATQGWLAEVLDQIKSTNRVDAERVYLTGLSLGGRAVYKLAEDRPTSIAAMLPASGVYDWWLKGKTCTYKNVPFWGFANSGDPIVNINSNMNSFISTVNGCQPAPTTPHLTTIYNANQHDSWSAMYNTGDVYQWLLSKTLSNPLNKILSVNPGTYPTITSLTYNLVGNASSANGNIVYYEWTKRQGPDVTIINPNSANPTLQDLKKGNYVFRFFVTDANGGSGYADVNITADPIANTDTQAPTVPSNLVSTNQTINSISLSWVASTDNVGVTGYDIYQGNTLVGSVNGTTTSFLVSGLAINTSYTFTVKAKDAANNISGASNQLIISTLADTQAPSIPSNLISPSQTNTSVSLSWTASTDNVGVTEYDIYKGGTQIGTVNGTTTSFLVSSLTINTPYSFTVAAKDAAGNLSSQSAVLNISTTNNIPDTQAPTVPSNLVSTNQTINSISLSWVASTDNVGVTGYDIYQGNTLVGSVNGTTTSFLVSGLAINTSYTFTVKAKDAANNISGASNQLIISTLADTQAPSIPSNLISPSQTNTSVSLSWTASTDNVGVTEYDIYKGGTQIGTVNGTTTSFLVSSLTINTPYSFTVAAKDAAGNLSSQSAVLNISTTNNIPDTQAPTAPSNLTSSNQTNNSISLNWTASTDNVGVTEYDIFQGNTQVGTVNGTTTNFVVPNLTANTSYDFTVKAKDAAGNISTASPKLTISTTNVQDTQPPTIPLNLISTNRSINTVSLSWDPSTDNVGVTGYEVYSGATLVGNVNSTSFIVTGLSPSTGYTFTVLAKDAAVNKSGLSNPVSISTLSAPDTQPPTAPGNLVSDSQTSKSISLQWSFSTDNVGVVGYDIYNGNSLIGSVGSNVKFYTILNLQPSTSLNLTVKAKDAAGNISTASNSVMVSTLTNSPPVVKLDAEQTIILPLDSLTITATATDVDNDPLTYTWSSNVDNINLTNNKTNTIKLNKLTLGSYILILTVSDKLSESVARIKINVLAAEIRDTTLFHAKRIFSPNGDGNNDEWSIKNINTFPNSKISILNASGQLIFTASSNNLDEFIWDGRAGGRDLPEGAYYYVVENGNKSIGSGSFVLIR